jgi:polar amino acid transport system substrate-binding protein
MKKLIVTLALFVLIFLPTIAQAEKVVFATTEWPPYAFTKDGQPSGINVEIVVELCKRLGIDSEIRVLPWQRALDYVEKGKVDAIFALRYTEERAKFVYYPSESLPVEKTVVMSPKGSGMKVNKIDDLKGKKIGVVRGYSYSPEFDNYQEAKKTICDDDNQLVKILGKKRIELAAGADEGSIKYLCKKDGIEVETLYVLNEAKGYIAFSKAIGERAKILGDKFSEALKKLKEEGFIEKVQSKYF